MSLWFIGVGLAGMAFGGFHLIVTGMKLAPATETPSDAGRA